MMATTDIWITLAMKYALTAEPAGKSYEAILELAVDCCDVALLVVRHRNRLGEAGQRVREKLMPYLLTEGEESEWPGTKLIGHTALVSRYGLNDSSVRILKMATNHLYGWLQPALPEDLCFIRGNGRPWLASIAHEKDTFLELDEAEYDQFAWKMPELAETLHKEGQAQITPNA